MLDGDRFIEELRQGRHEADKRQRLAIFQALMVNKADLCEVCGAHKANYREMMHEECWNGHQGGGE